MAANNHSVSIVIIDDNPRSLEFLSTALTRPGLKIFTAHKPEDGLAIISMYRPKIVLTDLVMPGLTGIDVLHRVKELDPAIEVIVMSARESGGSPSKVLEQGATDFLKKPISLHLLRERVGRRIDKYFNDPAKV
ncbi:MAG TPA: response regulator [Candidatus Angelobacter sp.]